MKYIAFLLLILAACILSACNATNAMNEMTLTNTQTGYWYLGDDGEQQWRTLYKSNTPPPAQAQAQAPAQTIAKKYASPFGRR